jgi:hypothetical protein
VDDPRLVRIDYHLRRASRCLLFAAVWAGAMALIALVSLITAFWILAHAQPTACP